MTSVSEPGCVAGEGAAPDDRGTYDFDLHGIVGIRLVDARRQDLCTVSRQLGPLRADLAREPDITIRFVDSATSEPVTYVGLGDAGFNRDGFFVLRGKGGVPAKALVPFDQIGRPLEMVCERALPAVPHLLTVINLTALTKGVLPLHASAFTTGSLGVLVTGWSKGGKTESLLAAMAGDGRYVGDEWVYLTGDGRMLGLPEPIRLWAWQLAQRPALLAARPLRERMRLATWRALAAVAGAGTLTRAPGSGVARKVSPVVQRQTYLQVPPVELFGDDRVVLRGHLDAVVLLLSHSHPGIDVRAAGRTEVSGRMLASLEAERAAFMDHYRQFRYAFPERSSAVLETASAAEARMLSSLFDHRPAAVVAHPHPCDIAALGRAVIATARDMAVQQGPRRRATVS